MIVGTSRLISLMAVLVLLCGCSTVRNTVKQWFGDKTQKHKEPTTQAIAEEPVQQTVVVPDEVFPLAKPVEKQPATVAPVSVPKSEPVVDDGPTVYYQWQGVPEQQGEQVQPAPQLTEQAQKQAQANQTTLDEIAKHLEPIQGIAYPNRMLFKKAMKKVLEKPLAASGIEDLHVQQQILALARHGPREPTDPLKQIQLTGDDCGCSRNFTSIVYGFYPYWQASGDKAQRVDFSLFDRIAFYALSLDQKGEITDPLQWRHDGNIAAFIGKAHKYRVDVDLAVSATGWQQWSDEVMAKAVRTTASEVKRRFTASVPDTLTDFVLTYRGPSSAKGDGVTLVFDDYGDSVVAGDRIVSFVEKLSQKLRPEKTGLKLNLMLGLDVDALQDTPVFKTLETILLKGENERAMVDYVFVFLQEPTTDAKKILRRMIEDEFHGAHRKEVLRKMVPVLPSTGHEKERRGKFNQFTDDLIYLQDNFAGVGLWPLPLATDPGAAGLKKAIIERYTATSGDHVVGGLYATINRIAGQRRDGDLDDGESQVNDIYASRLCGFVCPNRWLFRIAFDLVAGALLIYALLSIWVFRLRDLSKQYFWYLLGAVLVTIGIFALSLVCDPFWHQRADAIVIGILVLGFIYALWRYISRATRPPLP